MSNRCEVLFGHLLFFSQIATQQESRFQPPFITPRKGLANKPAFAFGNLVLQQTRGQQGKWIVHTPSSYDFFAPLIPAAARPTPLPRISNPSPNCRLIESID